MHKVWRCRRRLPRPPVLSAVPKDQGSYRFRRHRPSGQHQPRRERRILAFRAQFRQVCDEIKTVVVFWRNFSIQFLLLKHHISYSVIVSTEFYDASEINLHQELLF